MDADYQRCTIPHPINAPFLFLRPVDQVLTTTEKMANDWQGHDEIAAS